MCNGESAFEAALSADLLPSRSFYASPSIEAPYALRMRRSTTRDWWNRILLFCIFCSVARGSRGTLIPPLGVCKEIEIEITVLHTVHVRRY